MSEEFFSFFKGNVRVLVIGRAIWTLGSSIPAPYYTLYMLALGATPSEVGIINALAIIGGTIFEPIGGYIADKRGRVKLVGIATFGYSLCFILFAVAPDWRILGAGQILQQMLFFYAPGLNAIMADSLPPGTRGRGYALERTFPLALGFIAPYLGALLISYFGEGDEALVYALRICYWLAFALSLVVAYMRLRYLRETHDVDGDAPHLRDLRQVLRDSYGGIIDTIRWLPHDLKLVSYIQVIQASFIAMVAPFWILYATENIGLSTTDWGLILLISGFVGLIAILPVGYFVDMFGSRKMVLVSIFLAIVSVGAFVVSSTFWTTTLILITLSISNSIVTPAWASLIADQTPRDRRGRVNALLGENGILVSTSRVAGGGVLLFIPSSIGAFVGGYLVEWNMQATFMILLLALITCMLISFKYLREPEKPEH